MAGGILLAAAALRSGLRMRRARRLGRFDADARARHLRLAKIAIAVIALGFAGGPISMFFLRNRPLFESGHALFATGSLALFAVAAFLGRRLEQGARVSRDHHALVAILAVLSAGLAFATGWVLLP